MDFKLTDPDKLIPSASDNKKEFNLADPDKLISNTPDTQSLGLGTTSLENPNEYKFQTRTESDSKERQAQNQSIADKWANGITKAAGIAGTSILENTAGVVYGLADAAINGDVSKMYHNDFNDAMSSFNEGLAKAMPNYHTKAEEDYNLLQKMGTANFWSDQALNGLGYMAGAIATGSLLSKFASVAKLARAGVVVDEIKLAELGGAKSIEGAAYLDKLAKPIKIANKVDFGKNAVLMSYGESAQEADAIYKDTKKNLTDDFIKKYGAENLNESAMESIEANAKAAGNFGFGANLAITGTVNALFFAKPLSAGYGANKLKVNDIILKDVEGIAEKQYVSEAVSTGKGMAKEVGLGIIEEGGQESAQLMIQKTLTDYYSQGFKDKKDQHDMVQSIINGLSQTLGTEEGAESFFLGALLGGPGAALQNRGAITEQNSRSAQMATIMNSPEFKKTINSFDNFVRASNYEKQKDEALKTGSKFDYLSAEFHQNKAIIKQFLDNGGKDLILQQYNDMQTMDETGFKQVAGYDVNKPLPKSQSEIISNATKLVESLDKTNNSIKELFPYSKNVFESPQEYKVLTDNLWHYSTSIENLDKRTAEIHRDLLKIASEGNVHLTGDGITTPFTVEGNPLIAQKVEQLNKDLAKAKALKEGYINSYKLLSDKTTQRKTLKKIVNTAEAESKKTNESEVVVSEEVVIPEVKVELSKSHQEELDLLDQEEAVVIASNTGGDEASYTAIQDEYNQKRDEINKKYNAVPSETYTPFTETKVDENVLAENEGFVAEETSVQYRKSQAKKEVKAEMEALFKPLRDEVESELSKSKIGVAQEIERQLLEKYKEGISAEAFARLKAEATEKYNKIVAEEKEKQRMVKVIAARAEREEGLKATLQSIPTLEELSPIEEVIFNGKKGFVFQTSRYNTETLKNEVFYAFQETVSGKVFEISRDSKLGYKAPLFNYFIKQIESNPTVEVAKVVSNVSANGEVITIDGKQYFNRYSNPISAINRNANGEVLSISLETKDGKKRTFKKFAQEIANVILLNTYNKLENEDSGTREEIKQGITEGDAGVDAKRKEQVASEEDRRESAKVENALKELNNKLDAAKKIAQDNINKELKELADKKAAIEITKAQELANKELKEQADLFEEAMKSTTSTELLEFLGHFKGHLYTSRLNRLYKDLKKSEEKSIEKNDSNDLPLPEPELDTKEPVEINEAPEVVNEISVNDDTKPSKKSSVWHKTTSGLDNISNSLLHKLSGVFYRTSESIKLDGHKLQVVTRVSNKELYEEIIKQDVEADRFENLPENKEYRGIWTILVDKNGDPVKVNGMYVASTLETAPRIDKGEVNVSRGLSGQEAAKAKAEAMRRINILRGEILGSKDGKYVGLQEGEVKYLKIDGKSKGLYYDGTFEPRDSNGNRRSLSVVGRIFNAAMPLSKYKLNLVTFEKNLLGVDVSKDKGKLFVQISDEGRLIDLVPRNLIESEIVTIFSLINKQLTGNPDIDVAKEIKKIISFRRNDKDPRFQIYFDGDSVVFGNNRATLADITLSEEGHTTVKMKELADFLKTKRANVNSLYLNTGAEFKRPSLDDSGEVVDYNEYLLEGEQPMFGTDLKEIKGADAVPNKRFEQVYFIYDPELVSDVAKESSDKIMSEIQVDNEAQVVPEISRTKRAPLKPRQSKQDGINLTRTKSVARYKSRMKVSATERDWFKKRFPNIPIEDMFGLIESKSFGQFTSAGSVLLSDLATTGTLYHEAFHAVTQLYLTKEEISKLYNEAVNSKAGKAKSKELGRDLSRQEIEEVLAEDFADYKSNGKILAANPIRNTLFKRILNFLKGVVGLSENDVQSVYEKLDNGYYTSKPIIGNREFSKLNRPKEVIKITKDKGTAFITDTLNSMNAMFFSKLQEDGGLVTDMSANIEKIADDIYNEFAIAYENVESDKLADDYKYIAENFNTFMKMFETRLNSDGIDLKISETKEDLEESDDNNLSNLEDNKNQTGRDSYQEGNLVSVLEGIASPTRMILRSLVNVDNNFNPILNSLGMKENIEFSKTYAFLLKNVAGVGSSYSDLYDKIESLIQFKPEFRELLDKLGKPSSEISKDAWRVQNQFLQDFNKNRTNAIITTFAADGNIRLVDANRLNEADKVKTIWENRLKAASRQNETGQMLVDPNITETKDALEFLAKIGISFDKSTLAIINSEDFDMSDINKSAEAIKIYIIHHKGDVTKMYAPYRADYNDSAEKKLADEKVAVAGGRLDYLLELEAKHTSQVNELSYISADNKTEYSVGENNGLSITANIINNAQSIQDLFTKLPHLNTISTEGSVWLGQMFNAKTGIRNKNVKVNLELHNGVKTASDVVDQIKFPTRKGTKGDMATQQMAAILSGKSNYIVSADKSQEFVLSLSNYNGNEALPIPIEAFASGFNSIKLKNIFRGYFKSEFKRIAKFELDGLGKGKTDEDFGYDIYNSNGGKFTIFQDILEPVGDVNVAKEVKAKLKELSEIDGSTYENQEVVLNDFLETLLPKVDQHVLNFFSDYSREATNFMKENLIDKKTGLPKNLTEKYSDEQLIRTVIVTDLINSIEQTKLFTGDPSFYKDLYKRTSMFAGTKGVGRIDDESNAFLDKNYPRVDGKLADGHENTIVFNDVKTSKQDVKDWLSGFKGVEISDKQAYEILGFSYDEKTGIATPEGAYGKYEEGDAMGWGSLDFFQEFHNRMGTWTPAMENAYNVIQSQVFDDNGNLISGRLLEGPRSLNKEDLLKLKTISQKKAIAPELLKESELLLEKELLERQKELAIGEIALFQTLKLQYAGPINSNKNMELFVPGGYKFTVMPLIPQMIAGKNLSKILDNMKANKAGVAVFKSGSKFGTVVSKKTAKANDFYSHGSNGEINSDGIFTQSISYQYLGLQVKPSEPHNEYIFSTQFRKTMLINAFENGNERIEGAQKMIDDLNSLLEERTLKAKDNLVKSLGLDAKNNYAAADVTKLVTLLSKSSEDRKLADNLIDSLDTEVVNGKTILKYNIDSMVNKSKIDSMLMSIVNSRLIKQKFNGDAYVLATVAGMEKLGNRPLGTNPALKGYGIGEDGETTPAEVMVAMSKAYYPLLNKFGSLANLNKAISEGKIDKKVLELIGSRIPGQGMNSNEYLTIKEFLPEDSATTMVAHPEIVAKAGSDFDNDKLYTYRPNIDSEGNYIEDNIDNKITSIIKGFISHKENFAALVTPNSTNKITWIVDDIKYATYLNNKIAKNESLKFKGKPEENIASKEAFLKTQSESSKNIRYTDLLKFHKKVEARNKLLTAKDEVGPSAIANAYGPLSQIAGLTANKLYTDLDGIDQEVNINLAHNETEDGSKINLASKKDAVGGNDISEINNQLINIIVDAAKDEVPMVAHLNMTMDTLPVYLYLNKMGVPFEHVAYFMTQPVMKEYLDLISKNRSVFLKSTGKNVSVSKIEKLLKAKYSKSIKDEVVKNYNNDVALEYLKKNLSAEELELINLNTITSEDLLAEFIEQKTKPFLNNNDEISLDKLKSSLNSKNRTGIDYDLLQYKILSNFLSYKKQAALFGDYVRTTNSDSSGLGQNINSSRIKLEDTRKTFETGFINGVENIMGKTFVKAFMHDKFVISAYTQFYDTQKPEIISEIEDIVYRLSEEASVQFKPFGAKEKQAAFDLATNDFINYIVQNHGYKNIASLRDKLFRNLDGNKSVARQLLDLKLRAEELENKNPGGYTQKDIEDIKLSENIFLKEMFPLINSANIGYDNIKIYSKKMDTFTSNQLTEAFRAIKDYNIELFDGLVNVGILQSGLNNSPITYMGLIPHEYYNELVKDAFKEFNSLPKEDTQNELTIFNQLFFANKDGVVGNKMFGKEFDKNKVVIINPAVVSTSELPGSETKINIYAGTGENVDLSNLASRPFKLGDGIIYPSVEHAFQAEKLQYSNKYSDSQKEEIVSRLLSMTASQAKIAGRKIEGVNIEEWNKDSSSIMKDLIRQSFEQNQEANKKLMATGNATLTHTQDKGKWGNEFPKLLMEVRNELRKVSDNTKGYTENLEKSNINSNFVSLPGKPTINLTEENNCG